MNNFVHATSVSKFVECATLRKINFHPFASRRSLVMACLACAPRFYPAGRAAPIPPNRPSNGAIRRCCPWLAAAPGRTSRASFSPFISSFFMPRHRLFPPFWGGRSNMSGDIAGLLSVCFMIYFPQDSYANHVYMNDLFKQLHMPEHDIDLRILRALRRIIRNAEQHSKALLDKHNVTAPQLICLRELVAAGMMPVLALAEQVGMSASTVVGIVDRLEQRKLVTRRRDLEDRRLVWIEPTEMGNALANSDASPLQYQLALSLAQLPLDEQLTIAASLERVVALMDMKPYDRSELPAIEPAPLPPPEEKEAPTLDG
ncbi:hypothetical protein DK843_11395 [Chromobacterium phragmitis]|uniref:HTH marR-type domain-containing protein n=2 Tax=Chromobacterium phragmitis TaxID=2202141 RepID=A0A344UHU7_9NEIS|nr:hypothetical protein DK843_11395 [Chromobacterium phragmitis]